MGARARLAWLAALAAAIAAATYIVDPGIPWACNTPNYGDTTPPAVAITNPSTGVSVSGSAVTVAASASDNVGVVGVQFKLDGAALQTEDTAAPYLISWDTTSSLNGTHALTAVARDAAGNVTTSNPISVTVANGGGGTTGSANIWVDSDGGACTRTSSVGSYVDANACSTFQNAYNLAQSGDTVNVKCGNYSTKTTAFINLTYSSAKDAFASNVVFSSADGTIGCVTLPNVAWNIQSGHVEFHHFTMDQTNCIDSTNSIPPCPQFFIATRTAGSVQGAHDVVMDDIQTSDFGISGAVYNITIQNTDAGPMFDNHGLMGCNGSTGCAAGTTVPHDILIQTTSRHDYQNSTACLNNDPGCPGGLSAHHEGCALTVNAGYNITFNRDHFFNCEDLPFYIHPFIGDVHDVTVENSDIGRNAQPPQIQQGPSALLSGSITLPQATIPASI